MVTVHQTVLALLVVQIYVSAAPSDVPKPEEIAEVKHDEQKLDSPPSILEDNKDDSNSTESQRQKRFYNPYGNGYPPFSPQYPTYNKRDQESDLGVYGIDDPLSQIHRRLQEIASVVRQTPPPPPPPVTTHFPFFFPVIYVPQFSCDCSSGSNSAQQPTAKPDTSRPTPRPPVDEGTTSPDIFNRWPEMEDERQNWGLVINETENEYDDGEDFSRPISFDPIQLNTTMSRPAPPVEHGSNQASRGESSASRPEQSSNDIPRPPINDRQPNIDSSMLPTPPSPASVGSAPGSFSPSSGGTPKEAPTTCDGAVLSCCHQPQVTYDCFSILGCPDPTSYGNPCDPLVILKVIEKYQRFYGVTNG